jgi:N-acetyl-gamma-glutamyl-phosphate reductase
MKKIKVGIINVTGYAGVEIARLVGRHPQAELVCVTGRSAAGKRLAEVFPHLVDIDMPVTAELEADVDVAFSAMGHKVSAGVILPLLKKGLRVIDMSADFRLKDHALYPKWYDFVHPAPELLKSAVFGIPELHREDMRKAQLVANAGCYPTSAILGLAPLVKAGLIEGDIIIDSKSGASGAGRTLTVPTHFCEAVDNVRPYGLSGHRHQPEIVQELQALNAKNEISITFVPHVVPMSRGIVSTCYARVWHGKAVSYTKLANLYTEFYQDEPFVRVVPAVPETKHTWGSNYCLVHPTVSPQTGKVVVVSCLDNLVKGAAGQAVQIMNIMFGFPETAGLEALPLYP